MQHDWIPTTLGHGDGMCRNCKTTHREAAALGILNACGAPAAKPGDWADERAESMVSFVMRAPAKGALEYVAAMLRVTKEEGVGEALRRVDESLRPLLAPGPKS